MEKIINKLINEFTKGVDTYTHNGSTWLIFTDTKQWVIELTESKTLWYNYNFFQGMFAYASMGVVDNQQYITKWAENNIINGSKNTPSPSQTPSYNMAEVLENGTIDSVRINEYPLTYVSKLRDCQDTIENGVKETNSFDNPSLIDVGYTIKNGVKENSLTYVGMQIGCNDAIENGVRKTSINSTIFQSMKAEDIIQDGVKRTQDNPFSMITNVEDAIENGVKETSKVVNHFSISVEDTIENGVKETNHVDVMKFFDNKMEDALENGIKETHDDAHNHKDRIDGVIKNGVKEINHIKNNVRETKQFEEHLADTIDAVINEGVKETIECDWNIPKYVINEVVKDGVKNIRGIGNDRSFFIEDTLEMDVKHTELHKGVRPSAVEHTIQNGIKETRLEMNITEGEVDDIIQDGIRVTFANTETGTSDDESWVESIIKEGVKETKTPGNGDIVSTVEWMKENNSNSYPKMIDDVIENGVKEVISYDEHKRGPVNTFGYIDDIIETGIIKTKEMDEWVNTPRIVDDVIDNGIKEVQPLPDQSGELIGYSNYYNLKEDRTKPFIDYLEETIKFGVKENIG